MDGDEDDFSATAVLLAEDNGADDTALFQAHVNVLMAVRRRARAKRIARRWRYRGCCNWQGLSPVLMPLTGLAPASPYFGLRAMGRLSCPK